MVSPCVERSREVVTFGLQPLVIPLIISQIELDQIVLARNRVSLLPVEWRRDQRIGSQSPFVIGVLEGRRLRFRRRCISPDPVVDTIGHQRFIDFAEIAVRAGPSTMVTRNNNVREMCFRLGDGSG